jgi:ribosome-binding ATPase
MQVGIVGFKQSGKSTFFSAISGKKAALPGSTEAPQAVVTVRDARIEWLSSLYNPKKTTFALIDCLDLPGISLAEPAGRSSARKLFEQLKTADMLVLAVRAFNDAAVVPYRGSVDARRDIRELYSEFILSDLEIALTRMERLDKQIRLGGKTQAQDQIEHAIHVKLQKVLESEQPASAAGLTAQELQIVKSLGFLTLKPFSVLVNLDEKGPASSVLESSSLWPEQEKAAAAGSVPVVGLCAKLEQELAQLEPEARSEFMVDLGISESAADRFVRSCYAAMGLISFFTVGPDEVRAWPIKQGSSALEAAGKIHSDIKRGFIRAETIAYEDLKTLGDEKAVKAAGKMRLEGKEYVMQDGDIVNFRFNV